MNILHSIPPLNDDGHLNVIVEIPKGSLNKYVLDKETGLIKLDRVSHTAQVFPFDYGFVPNTLWHDGDPLDVVLLTTAPLFPGVWVEARPVAVMDMNDSGDSDAKIIAVPSSDPRFKNIKDLSDVNEHFIKEVTHFYEHYKKLQNKVVTIDGVRDKASAEAVIKESIELYASKNK